MAYSVPDLAYAFDALEPHIDARTMEIHHDKHHGAYVTNLNAALEGTEWMDRPIEAVLAVPDDEQGARRVRLASHVLSIGSSGRLTGRNARERRPRRIPPPQPHCASPAAA